MPIPIQCTHCSFKFRVPDTFAGKRGQCPECNTIFRAPTADAIAAKASGIISGTAGSQADEQTSRSATATTQAPAQHAQGGDVASTATSPASAEQSAPLSSSSPQSSEEISPDAVTRNANHSDAAQPATSDSPAAGDQTNDSEQNDALDSPGKDNEGTSASEAVPPTPPPPQPPPVNSSSQTLPQGTAVAPGDPLQSISAVTSHRPQKRARRTGMPRWAWVGLSLCAVASVGMLIFVILNGPLGASTEVAKKPEETQTKPPATTDSTNVPLPPPPDGTEEPLPDTGQKHNPEEDPNPSVPATGNQPMVDSTAKEDPQNLAPSEEPKLPVKSPEIPKPEKFDALVAACDAFGWKPTTPAHYNKISDLARLMTTAESIEVKPEGPTREQVKAIADAAGTTIERIAEVDWNVANIRAINQFTVDNLDRNQRGIMFVGEIKGRVDNALLLQIDETPARILMPVYENIEQFKTGSRWLVLGVTTTRLDKLQDTQNPDVTFSVPVIDRRYIVLIDEN